jgi:SAM-dependent methyltransferase
MCTHACLEFTRANLRPEEVQGRAVIEVGALDVNGPVRPLVGSLGPASYVGVDLQAGPGVDEICDATGLVARFGPEAFDLLISTELLEHVRDWRSVISQFKQILRPGGRLLVTTRSRGFPNHAYPDDFWRYELADIRAIFSDFSLEVIESDSVHPGVLFKARKPEVFVQADTRQHALFSMITRREALAVTDAQIAAFHRRGKVLRILGSPSRFVRRIRGLFRA